jgi:CheY-like chemotaxis protein
LNKLLGFRVLYVEDNADLREVIAALLRSEGYEVVVAESALDGLACLDAATFDIVISDFALPDYTGAWMLREAAAKGLTKDTPAFIVTACPSPELEDTLILPKPLDFDRFLALIADLVRGRTPEPLAPPSRVVEGQRPLGARAARRRAVS